MENIHTDVAVLRVNKSDLMLYFSLFSGTSYNILSWFYQFNICILCTLHG